MRVVGFYNKEYIDSMKKLPTPLIIDRIEQAERNFTILKNDLKLDLKTKNLNHYIEFALNRMYKEKHLANILKSELKIRNNMKEII